MIVKRGSKGEVVRAIQERLNIEVDGKFGPDTDKAVKKFQGEHGLLVDGKVGPDTLAALAIVPEEILATDRIDAGHVTDEGLFLHSSYLDRSQYIEGPTDKFYVVLHHTAGNHDPYATVRAWNSDTRGRIATQFIVGGIGKNDEQTHDGEVVQCFPDEAWAYHLGKNNSPLLHPHSIGIEICNYGWLEPRDGRFYTYVNSALPDSQVVDLGFSFRGYRYYHKYTEAQMDAVYKLLQEISRRHEQVNLQLGLPQWLKNQSSQEAFAFKQEACDGKVRGLLTHVNIRPDKTDCSPQPQLVEMLKSL